MHNLFTIDDANDASRHDIKADARIIKTPTEWTRFCRLLDTRITKVDVMQVVQVLECFQCVLLAGAIASAYRNFPAKSQPVVIQGSFNAATNSLRSSKFGCVVNHADGPGAGVALADAAPVMLPVLAP